MTLTDQRRLTINAENSCYKTVENAIVLFQYPVDAFQPRAAPGFCAYRQIIFKPDLP